MKTILAILFALTLSLCAGCSTSTIQLGSMRAHNTRWVWDTRNFTALLTDTNGMKLELSLASSSAQAEAIEAAAAGVARGLAASQGR
jgi:hypothetical protein